MGKKKWRRKYERLLERCRWLEACKNTPVDTPKPSPETLKPFAGDWIPVDGWTVASPYTTSYKGTGEGCYWHGEGVR